MGQGGAWGGAGHGAGGKGQARGRAGREEHRIKDYIFITFRARCSPAPRPRVIDGGSGTRGCPWLISGMDADISTGLVCRHVFMYVRYWQLCECLVSRMVVLIGKKAYA